MRGKVALNILKKVLVEHFGTPTLWNILEHLHFETSWNTYTLEHFGTPTLWNILKHLHFGTFWNTYTLELLRSPTL